VRRVAIALLFGCAACQQPSAAFHSATPSTSSAPAVAQCPDGKPARTGLQNFGAYIGTWQANRPHDVQFPSDYTIGTLTGRVTVRCSTTGYVIVEEIRPVFGSPAGQAVRVALTDIPTDGQKVYDHVHARCRLLQYISRELARQLGADDPDGRVDIMFQSDGNAYNSASVKLIRMDLLDALGSDTRPC